MDSSSSAAIATEANRLIIGLGGPHGHRPQPRPRVPVVRRVKRLGRPRASTGSTRSTASEDALRVRNFETGTLPHAGEKNADGKVTHARVAARQPSKVNDRDGNPIEISAIVVWKVVDTAERCSRSTTTRTSSTCRPSRRCETWRRRHPYDSEDHEVSLRGNAAEVCEQLKTTSRSGWRRPASR